MLIKLGYYSWMQQNFPSSFVPMNNQRNLFDHVYFDVNAYLRVSNDASLDKLSKLVSFILKRRLLNSSLPKKSLFLALDGQAPWAKFWTQKTRRDKEAIRHVRKKKVLGPADPFNFYPGSPVLEK